VHFVGPYNIGVKA